MVEHGRTDRVDRRARQTGDHYDSARADRPVRILLHTARARRRHLHLRDRRRGLDAGVAKADATYRLGSAATIAMASPFGETASLETAPRLYGATSRTSVQPVPPRLHE